MANSSSRAGSPSARPLRQRLLRWQVSRTWARLIREAEGLWHVDVREMHRLAAEELGSLVGRCPRTAPPRQPLVALLWRADPPQPLTGLGTQKNRLGGRFRTVDGSQPLHG